MDLEKIEEIRIESAIMKLENEAIRPSRRIQVGFLRVFSALITCLGGIAFCIVASILSIAVFQYWLLAFAGFFLGFGSAFVVGIVSLERYLTGYPYEKAHLFALLDPAAKAFAEEHWEKRKELVEDASAYNRALGAMKRALPENTGDEVSEGVIENFIERRRKLTERLSAYEEAFRSAAEEEIRQVKLLRTGKSNKPKTKRQRLKAFNRKVWELKCLEEALDDLKDSVEKGMTVDLSPYIAAQRLRAELEEERATMVAEGLKPKKLPASHSLQPKLLPAEV